MKKKPGFQGKVTLKFTIAPGGEVISISIASSTTGYGEFDGEIKNAVSRTIFEGSQTNKGRWARHENVEKVFELIDSEAVCGKHLLLVDDVVTTGATCIACAKALCQAGDVRISILSLGFAKS